MHSIISIKAKDTNNNISDEYKEYIQNFNDVAYFPVALLLTRNFLMIMINSNMEIKMLKYCSNLKTQ